MNSGSLASFDWGTLALVALIAAAIVWGLRVFLRQNRKDLDILEEELRAAREAEEKEQPPL